MPREHARWRSDVRHARYPGGESFNDLILRVEGVLIDIEQQTSPVLVVSHLSTLQVPGRYLGGLWPSLTSRACELAGALRLFHRL